MIFRSIRSRAAFPWLVALGVLSAAGCSASIKAEAKTGPVEDDREYETAPPPPPLPSHRAVSDRPPTATFPGFRVLDDDGRRSVVMVEVSRNVDVTEQKAEGRLVYVMSGTAVSEKVNRLPLVATHFGTAVSRIHLEQSGADALLVIETRSPVTATHRIVKTDNGVNIEVSLTGEPWGRGAVEARGPYQNVK